MQKEQRDFIENLRTIIQNWSKTPVGKSNRWLKYIVHTPDLAHLLVKLSAEPELPANQKSKLAAAIAYFISPMDLIPETYWGALGYVDDITLAALVLKDILTQVEPQIIMRHWSGTVDLLPLIDEILGVAAEMVGSEYYLKLQALIKQ